MINKRKIEWHADDYGLFPEQSRRILKCAENGKLNAISVFPNSDALEECMHLLADAAPQVSITVHLNLIEGKSLTSHIDTPFLTDEDGVFSVTFGKLLAASFSMHRNEWKTQLKKELRAQIYAVMPFLSGKSLRLDSHAHYHMIPVVFDALMEVISEDKLYIEYIRIPKEYLSLYLKHFFQLKGLKPINLVKVIVLNMLSGYSMHKYGNEIKNANKSFFMGVLLSDNMNNDNVRILISDALLFAEKKDFSLEILAHPGGVYEESDIQKITFPNDIAFMTSDNRRKEAEMFMQVC